MKKITFLIALVLFNISAFAEVIFKNTTEQGGTVFTVEYNNVLFSCEETCFCPDSVKDCTGECVCPYESHRNHTARDRGSIVIECMSTMKNWYLDEYKNIDTLPSDIEKNVSSDTQLITCYRHNKNKDNWDGEALTYYIKDGDKWLVVSYFEKK